MSHPYNKECCCVECCHARESKEPATPPREKDVEPSNFVRALQAINRLREENASMRTAITEAHDHLCNVGSGRGCLLGFDLDDAMPDIEAATTTLSPFTASK